MATTGAGSFTDHPRKILFRTLWAKPILHYIHAKLKRKLIYLGLPGIKALDILEWKEYLEVVIAFQCENYDDRNDETEIDELIEILNDLEQRAILDYYSLYIGYIEQVIVSGDDDNGIKFKQSEIVTVYNLDFCNPLTSPFKVYDKKNKRTIRYHKLHAIDKLLSFEHERCLEEPKNFFVMFLTVNSIFWADEMEVVDDEVIMTYINANLANLTGEKKDVRLLKAYTYYHLQKQFSNYGFHAEILPVLYYRGSGGYTDNVGQNHDHWLLTFTILGTPINYNNPPVAFHQNSIEFLERKFAFISNTEITCFTDARIDENGFEPVIDPLLNECFSHNNIWIEELDGQV